MIAWRNTSTHWGAVSKGLHWSVALLVFGLLIVGFVMHDIEDFGQRIAVIQLHKSAGTVLLVLVVVRLYWRATNPTPDLPSGMQNWERLGAIAVHWLLLALLVLQPLTGLLASFASGFPFEFFMLFDIPTPLERNKGLQEIASNLHGLFAFLLMLALAAHIGAALRHQFLKKDGLIGRMLPGTRGLRQ